MIKIFASILPISRCRIIPIHKEITSAAFKFYPIKVKRVSMLLKYNACGFFCKMVNGHAKVSIKDICVRQIIDVANMYMQSCMIFYCTDCKERWTIGCLLLLVFWMYNTFMFISYRVYVHQCTCHFETLFNKLDEIFHRLCIASINVFNVGYKTHFFTETLAFNCIWFTIVFKLSLP